MYTRWLFDAVDRNRRARAFDWAFCRKNISNCKVNILSKRTVIRLSNALAHTVCSCRKPTEKTKNTEKKMEKKKQRGKAHRNRNKCDRPHSQYNDNSRRQYEKKHTRHTHISIHIFACHKTFNPHPNYGAMYVWHISTYMHTAWPIYVYIYTRDKTLNPYSIQTHGNFNELGLQIWRRHNHG